MAIILVRTICTLFLFSSILYSQGAQTAVPFLTISPSGEYNGSAGITISSFAETPSAMIFNPAHLGFLSRTTAAGTEFYLQKSPTSSGLPAAGQSFNSYSAVAGYRFNSMNIGAGYAKIVADYGMLELTNGSNPAEKRSFHVIETSENISLGLGFRWGPIDGAFGFTLKQITSHLPGSSAAGTLADLVARPKATDVGVIFRLPIMDILHFEQFTLSDNMSPFVNVTVAYALNNFGDEVSYSSTGQSDPLPEMVRLGWSADAGYRYKTGDGDFTLAAVQIAREADESMIRHSPIGIAYHKNLPASDMNIYRSLIEGSFFNAIAIRKGAAITFLETVTMRSGYHQFTSIDWYRTTGFTVSTNGLFALLRQRSAQNDNVSDILRRIEFRFTRSQYSGGSVPIGIDTFNSLVFILYH
jgi:hypothetical protein